MKSINHKRKSSDAVSPVVGVMLMLVVVIIIAAVVSAFAGGLTSDQKKAPLLNMDVHILNSGSWDSSYYSFRVLNVDKPIPTKDLKIITSWKATDGTTGGGNVTGWTSATAFTVNGTVYYGNSHYGSASGKMPGTTQAPYGFGQGVNRSCQSTSSTSPCKTSGFYPDQQFGNYTLMSGTMMQNGPSSNYGKTSGTGTVFGPLFEYTDAEGYWDPVSNVDCVQALLGMNWNHLRSGDTVNVRFIHIPSGKVIYNQDVTVGG